jgi:hypothetical protein
VSGRYAKVMGDHWRTRAAKVSLAANGLWAVARTYIADNASDGVVHETFLAGLCGGKVDRKALSELIDAGWWTPCGGGYLDVTYLDENISRARAEELRGNTRERVAKHRATKPVTPPDGNDGGNGPGNSRSNEASNALQPPLPSDTKTPRHQDTSLASLAQSARAPDECESRPPVEGPTPAGIVEAALVSALGAVGAKLVLRSGDGMFLREAADSMKAADPRPLRDVAAEWCPHFVAEFRSRTPKNLALYAQSRAANGGAKLPPAGRPAKQSGWLPPADSSAFVATEITDDLFRREGSNG